MSCSTYINFLEFVVVSLFKFIKDKERQECIRLGFPFWEVGCSLTSVTSLQFSKGSEAKGLSTDRHERSDCKEPRRACN